MGSISSQMAAAQADIDKYYDSLPVLRIIHWMLARGVDRSVLVCILRHQMCPCIELKCGASNVIVKGRTIGGLTGSRTAGLLGRVPVEPVIADRHEHWRRSGFHADSTTLCVCTWVDNLFSVSDTLLGAIGILEDFEDQLMHKWRLSIKASSRACMFAAGCSDLPDNSTKWPLVDYFPILGHVLQCQIPDHALRHRSVVYYPRLWWFIQRLGCAAESRNLHASSIRSFPRQQGRTSLEKREETVPSQCEVCWKGRDEFPRNGSSCRSRGEHCLP